MKKISIKQEGTLFLLGICSFIWFFISINNNNELLFSLIGGIILGAISTFILAAVFAFMKAVFEW